MARSICFLSCKLKEKDMNKHSFWSMVLCGSMIACSDDLQNVKNIEEEVYFQKVGIVGANKQLHQAPSVQGPIIDSALLALFFDCDFWELSEIAQKEGKTMLQTCIDWESKKREAILREESFYLGLVGKAYQNFQSKTWNAKWSWRTGVNRPKTPEPEQFSYDNL